MRQLRCVVRIPLCGKNAGRGGAKDRCNYSEIAEYVKGSTKDTWYPVYVSSKHSLFELRRVGAGGTVWVALVRQSPHENGGARCGAPLARAVQELLDL